MPTAVLTRALEENRRIAPLFEAFGLTVRSAPLVELVALEPDESQLAALAAGGPLTVLVSSAHATALWIDLRASSLAACTIESYLIVGERSARMIAEAEPDAKIQAVIGSAAELLDANLAGVRRVVYPCSVARRDEAVDGLASIGVEVVELPLYAPAIPASAGDDLRSALTGASNPFALCFFSPSAVENFFSLQRNAPDGAIFVAIGATTASALRQQGVENVLLPDRPEAKSMAERIARHFKIL